MTENSKAGADSAIQEVREIIGVSRAEALSATLDHDAPPKSGDGLPPLWHWAYFWPIARMSSIGKDGHPKKGGFLPDLGLPRRMAAGGRFKFLKPVMIGKEATRISRVTSVEEKTGRSGRLAFVTVTHAIYCDGQLAIEEEQDIVYREPAAPGTQSAKPKPAPDGALWEHEIRPSEALLFRYSALTFNSHRIHYDKPYAKDVEGYRDLVVHGPLIATLLIDQVTKMLPDKTITAYEYRATQPIFLGGSFHVCGLPSADGASVDLWAKDGDRSLAMTAKACLS